MTPDLPYRPAGLRTEVSIEARSTLLGPGAHRIDFSAVPSAVPTTRPPILAMRLRSSLSISLLLLAASCGGSSDPSASVDAGYDALSANDPSTALSSFDAALAGLAESDPAYVDAKLGQLRAQSYTDPAKAKAGFLALAGSSELKAGNYRTQVTDLVAAATEKAKTGNAADTEAAKQMISSAVEILTAGSKAFPADTKWAPLIKSVGDKAKSLGAADALAGLSGLGYVGGD